MPGVPLDSPAAAPDPNASWSQPPDEGKVKGGFFRTLMGRKRQEEQDQETRHATWVMDTLHQISTGQSEAPDSIVKLLVREAGSVFGPEFGGRLKEHFDQVNAEKQLNAKRQLLDQSAPKPMGVPAVPMPAAAAPAPAVEAQNFSPVRGFPQPPQPAPDASAMMQQLMPLLAQARPQQAPQAAPAPQPKPPGMPPLPNTGGAEAGPAPAQNASPAIAETKEGAVRGGAGFGVPPPAPLPPPSEGNIFRMGPVQRGVDTAAKELPSLQQANQLALQQAGAVHAQTLAQDQAEAERKMKIIEADPNFIKLPPLQQQEIRMRVMNVTGPISNISRPMNLPRSQIHGPDIPEGALGLDGLPISRIPGKWYQQQQDPVTGDIRYYTISPAVTTTQKLTAAGPVLVSVDRAGNVVKVAHSIDGSEIVDPRLLATVNTSMGAVPVVTKDSNGDPVTTWVMKEGSTSAQKVMPGAKLPAPPQAGGAAAPQASGAAVPRGAAPAQGGPAPVASGGGGRRGVSLPPTLPKADPAATYNAVQYARTTQKVFPTMDKLIAQLESTGDLGVIASKWNEFMAGTIGKGDERYTALRAHMGMLSTALTVIHKTRGIEMAKHFQELADSGKMDATTFKSAYNALKQWVGDYATMGAGAAGAIQPGGGTSPAPANKLTPPPLSTYEH